MSSAITKLGRLGLLTRQAVSQRSNVGGVTLKRHGHHAVVYRQSAPPDRPREIAAEVAGTFMWWWIFWHCFTDYGHIIGEFPFPDASKWTDAELGIKAD